MREDIPCKELKVHRHPLNIEGIFIEFNLRKNKWLLFVTYCPPSQVDEYLFDEVGKNLDRYSQIYSKFLLIAYFNAEESEPVLVQFLYIYGFRQAF